MDLLTFLMQPPHGLPSFAAQGFLAHWTTEVTPKGTQLVMQGQAEDHEYILLSGCVASEISDAEGRHSCVGLYRAPCVVTPHVARSQTGVSLVTLTTHADALVAQMPNNTLSQAMLASEPVRDWANAVLRGELGRKAAREWGLAALGGAERLAWFRHAYPDHETLFPHHMIASFLGVSPVTFSRLRSANPD